MNRQLPEFKIDGTVFLVDVGHAELREKEHPLNILSFFDMDHDGHAYFLKYDCIRKTIASPFQADNDNLVTIELPLMVNLDPEGMASKYSIPISELPEFDEDLVCRVDLIEKRLKGILPAIDICGDTFTVDWRLRELRKATEPYDTIPLNHLEMSPNGHKYVCLYNTEQKRIATLTEAENDTTDKIVALSIPNELYLDAVAVARQYGMDDLNFIHHYPIQEKLSATVLTISEAGVKTKQTKEINENEKQEPSARKRGRRL
jgi:hypothetical protein